MCSTTILRFLHGLYVKQNVKLLGFYPILRILHNPKLKKQKNLCVCFSLLPSQIQLICLFLLHWISSTTNLWFFYLLPSSGNQLICLFLFRIHWMSSKLLKFLHLFYLKQYGNVLCSHKFLSAHIDLIYLFLLYGMCSTTIVRLGLKHNVKLYFFCNQLSSHIQLICRISLHWIRSTIILRFLHILFL